MVDGRRQDEINHHQDEKNLIQRLNHKTGLQFTTDDFKEIYNLPKSREEKIKKKAEEEKWNLFSYYQEIINLHSLKRATLAYQFPEMLEWIFPVEHPNENIPEKEALIALAIQERWNLEKYFKQYCQALIKAGKKPPQLPNENDVDLYRKIYKSMLSRKERQRLKKAGGVFGISDLPSLVYETYSQVVNEQQQSQPTVNSLINSQNPFDRTILRLDDYSIVTYLNELNKYLVVIQEIQKDPSHSANIPTAEAIIRERINQVAHQSISLILALDKFGAYRLSKKQREILTSVPDNADLSLIFGYDPRLDPILSKEEKEKKQRIIKERKKWFDVIQSVLDDLKQSKKALPFVIHLPNEEKKIGAELPELRSLWEEAARKFNRRQALTRLLEIAAGAVAAYGASNLPLVKFAAQESKIIYQEYRRAINQLLSEPPPSGIPGKIRRLMEIAKTTINAPLSFWKEIGQDVGINFLSQYREEINKTHFPDLAISEASGTQLTEQDFIKPIDKPPQTAGELTALLETELGKRKFINALVYNFYKIGSFRFPDEDRFSYIPEDELNEKLALLIDKMLPLLKRESPDKRLDSLNPTSKKQGALFDWQELVIEVLKNYSPNLPEINLLEPYFNEQGYYIDAPLEYCRKRLGYRGVEQIMINLLINKEIRINPSVVVRNQQELSDFLQNNPLDFNYSAFQQWLNNYNQLFPDEETKWQFVSWALSLQQTGEIDLDLVSKFVDLSRFLKKNPFLTSQNSTGQQTLIPFSAIALGTIYEGAREKITRRQFLKAAAVGTGALATYLSLEKLNQVVESPYQATTEILQGLNSNLKEEAKRRLTPILNLHFNGFPSALIVKTSNGQEIGRYFQQNREILPFDQIPQRFKNFLTAVEDKNFFDHDGVDPLGIVRALTSIGGKGGGSTLTQQLIRLFCFSQNELLQEQTNSELAYQRKAVEIIAALIFEKKWEEYFINQGFNESDAKKLTKNKILELYLNNVPLGPNIYGVKAASKFYFNKEPSQLTEIEAAFLIGLIQNPVGYNPLSTSRYDSAGQLIITANPDEQGRILLNDAHPAMRRLRRDIIPVLREQNEISDEVVRSVNEQTIIITPPQSSEHQDYVNMAVNQILNQLSPSQIYSGLEIIVPIDIALQTTLQSEILNKVQQEANNGVTEGAVVILDGETGGILAATGAKVSESGEVVTDNSVCWTANFPGSTVKPFTYARALAEDKINQNSLLTGSTYRGINNAGERNYSPQPWPIALASSLNTAAQQTADRIGATLLSKTWQDLGLSPPSIADISTNLTLGTQPVTPVALAGAYTPFANQGRLNPPTSITEVRQNGRTVFTNSQPPTQVFSPKVADLILNALMNPENKILPRPETWQVLRDGNGWYFAKSGTESNASGVQRAVWMTGGMIHPQTGKKYIVVAYLGTHNPAGMSSTVWGVSTAGPFWRQVIELLKQQGGQETN
ncbi:MAG: transglycosylase domain-containing protein [Microgenomates group bacterium]|nr:transglycosylase domain-containing protein [Microgenomates group bacterium]